MKLSGDYLEHRWLNDGRQVAVDDLPQGRGTVLIGTPKGTTTASWEYPSITGALIAWFAWDPTKSAEPTGYERRNEARS